jgi:hypothetical protein
MAGRDFAFLKVIAPDVCLFLGLYFYGLGGKYTYFFL